MPREQQLDTLSDGRDMPALDDHAFANFDEPGKAADSLAENARLSLVSLVEQRRRRDERLANVIASQNDGLRRLQEELRRTRREMSEVILENETLKKNHVVLMQNHRRLYLGFVSLLKSVEDACGAEIGVDQRIEATLLSSDIGNVLGDHADIATAKAREFLAATEPSRIL